MSLGREGAVSQLVDYDAISTADLDAYVGLTTYDLDGFEEDPERRYDHLKRWWFFRMSHTPRPLEEKMTLFWHNHFATSITKVLAPELMYAQNQIFRTRGMGSFRDLLLEVSRDPAMLVWLDNASNVKDAPNENFAREVMELFTMGVGHYTQRDVTEAARAFTGWTIDPDNHNRFYFNPSVHDYGTKVFLESSGAYRGENIVDILAARPETAAFLSAKLARFFLGRDPSAQLWQALQNVYTSTNGSIREIVRAILLSDDFDETSRAPDMLKSPVEFVIGATRATGLEFDQAWATAFWFMEIMGMALFRPPNVGGWKGGRAWIRTDAYLFRMNFLWGFLASPFSPWGEYYRWNLSRFFEGRIFHTADELIDFVADRLSVVELPASVREALRGYVEPPDQPFDWNPASYDWLGRGTVYLLMASAEYQLQ